MNKTIHKKLTDKYLSNHAPAMACYEGEDMLTGLAHEMKILHAAGKDLMQPRPEAIARLLKMAKEV